MIRLVGISGSLRGGSLNSALLRAAQSRMPADTSLEIATLDGIPLYDGDLEEASGIPDAVAALKEAIAAADGLLIVTPEYNNSIPGVLKNAIDWASRPPRDSARVFAGRPVAVIGASPGGFGTLLSQQAWLPVFAALGTSHWHGSRLLVPHASAVFDDGGRISDETVAKRLTEFLAGFVSAVRGGKG